MLFLLTYPIGGNLLTNVPQCWPSYWSNWLVGQNVRKMQLDNNKYYNYFHHFTCDWKLDQCEGLCSKLHSYSNWFKSCVPTKIYCGWIQSMNWFKNIIPSNQCWLGWYSSSKNVVAMCCKFPPLSCRNYFINILSTCCVLATWLCVQPLLLMNDY